MKKYSFKNLYTNKFDNIGKRGKKSLKDVNDHNWVKKKQNLKTYIYINNRN